MGQQMTSIESTDDNNKRQSDIYAKNSFSRFGGEKDGEKLCSQLLSYLSLEDRFRCQSVSQLFRRTVFTSVVDIKLNDDFIKRCQTSNQTMTTIGIKCTNIETIDCRGILQLSLNWLRVFRRLKTLRLAVDAAIDGQWLEPLSDCKSLTDLAIDLIQVNQNVMKDCHQYCPRLEYLYIHDLNSIIVAECLSHIARLPALQTLVSKSPHQLDVKDSDLTDLLDKCVNLSSIEIYEQ